MFKNTASTQLWCVCVCVFATSAPLYAALIVAFVPTLTGA